MIITNTRARTPYPPPPTHTHPPTHPHPIHTHTDTHTHTHTQTHTHTKTHFWYAPLCMKAIYALTKPDLTDKVLEWSEAPKRDGCLCSSATEALVKYQSDTIILKPISRLRNFTRLGGKASYRSVNRPWKKHVCYYPWNHGIPMCNENDILQMPVPAILFWRDQYKMYIPNYICLSALNIYCYFPKVRKN